MLRITIIVIMVMVMGSMVITAGMKTAEHPMGC
jgi:hypothetical protein